MDKSSASRQSTVHRTQLGLVAGGMILLCAGAALLVWMPDGFLFPTAMLLNGGAVLMLLAIVRRTKYAQNGSQDPEQ